MSQAEAREKEKSKIIRKFREFRASTDFPRLRIVAHRAGNHYFPVDKWPTRISYFESGKRGAVRYAPDGETFGICASDKKENGRESGVVFFSRGRDEPILWKYTRIPSPRAGEDDDLDLSQGKMEPSEFVNDQRFQRITMDLEKNMYLRITIRELYAMIATFNDFQVVRPPPLPRKLQQYTWARTYTALAMSMCSALLDLLHADMLRFTTVGPGLPESPDVIKFQLATGANAQHANLEPESRKEMEAMLPHMTLRQKGSSSRNYLVVVTFTRVTVTFETGENYMELAVVANANKSYRIAAEKKKDANNDEVWLPKSLDNEGVGVVGDSNDFEPRDDDKKTFVPRMVNEPPAAASSSSSAAAAAAAAPVRKRAINTQEEEMAVAAMVSMPTARPRVNVRGNATAATAPAAAAAAAPSSSTIFMPMREHVARALVSNERMRQAVENMNGRSRTTGELLKTKGLTTEVAKRPYTAEEAMAAKKSKPTSSSSSSSSSGAAAAAAASNSSSSSSGEVNTAQLNNKVAAQNTVSLAEAAKLLAHVYYSKHKVASVAFRNTAKLRSEETLAAGGDPAAFNKAAAVSARANDTAERSEKKAVEAENIAKAVDNVYDDAIAAFAKVENGNLSSEDVGELLEKAENATKIAKAVADKASAATIRPKATMEERRKKMAERQISERGKARAQLRHAATYFNELERIAMETVAIKEAMEKVTTSVDEMLSAVNGKAAVTKGTTASLRAMTGKPARGGLSMSMSSTSTAAAAAAERSTMSMSINDFSAKFTFLSVATPPVPPVAVSLPTMLALRSPTAPNDKENTVVLFTRTGDNEYRASYAISWDGNPANVPRHVLVPPSSVIMAKGVQRCNHPFQDAIRETQYSRAVVLAKEDAKLGEAVAKATDPGSARLVEVLQTLLEALSKSKE